MKLIFTFLVALFIYTSVLSQSIKIGKINPNSYPKISFELSLIDSNGTQIKPIDKNKLTILDNKIQRIINSINCSDTLAKYSLTIALDQSGTMSQGADGINGSTPSKFTNAKNGLLQLVDKLPMDRYEIQFITFTTQTQLRYSLHLIKNQNDVDSIKHSISNIGSASGSTNFETSLEGKNIGNPFTYVPGILDYAAKTRYKSYIILLTDGEPAFDALINTAGCIDSCNMHDITFYTLGIGADLNGSNLGSITTSSKGKIYNNLVDQQSIDDAVNDILSKNANEFTPCLIEYTTDCSGGSLEVQYADFKDKTATQSYNLNPNVLPTLTFMAPSISFRNTHIGNPTIQNVKLKAFNNNINLNSITTNSPTLTIIDYSGKTLPTLLKSGDELEIKVQYIPTDTVVHLYTITANSNACLGSYNDSLKNTLKVYVNLDSIQTDIENEPNPTNPVFSQIIHKSEFSKFILLNFNRNSEIILYDYLGQEVYHLTNSDQPLLGLNTGQYYYKIIENNKQKFGRIMLVE